jgi:Secretion system C-terminal sorting domain/Calcineurin-like phosphoesterase
VPMLINMSNLSANTQYYYTVQYRPSGSGAFTSSPEYFYHTQRAVDTAFTFDVEADEHLYDYGNIHLYKVAMNNVLQDKPDFLISLGDMFGDDHYPFTITSEEVDSLRRDYRPWLGAACNSVPFFICQGNHDGEKMYYLDTLAPNNLGTWATLWRKYYYANPEPNGFYTGNTNPEGNGIGLPQDYYSFNWGNTLFVVLDAYRFDCDSVDPNVDSLVAKPNGWDWTLGWTQYSWLKNTLENSTAKFKFVFVHHPNGEDRGGIVPAKLNEWGGYEQNGHYNFPAQRPGWPMPIHQLFVNYGVNILFQGHDHLFAHEVMDSVTYQEVPMMADSTYDKGGVNADAYTADTFENTGYVRVTVSSSCVHVEYVKNYLPRDTLSGINHNKEVAFDYYLGVCDTTPPTGIRSVVNNNLVTVFPNPAKEYVTVLFADNPHSYTLKLVDDVGQVIAQSHTNQVNVSKVAGGIYFLEIETPGYTTNKKIIVTH